MSIIFRQDADIPEYHFMAFSESLEELILTGISNDDLVEVKKTDLQVILGSHLSEGFNQVIFHNKTFYPSCDGIRPPWAGYISRGGLILEEHRLCYIVEGCYILQGLNPNCPILSCPISRQIP